MYANVDEAAWSVFASASPAFAPWFARPPNKNAAHGCAGRRYIGIEVVREVDSRTAAHLYGHILAVFAGHDALNVAFRTG